MQDDKILHGQLSSSMEAYIAVEQQRILQDVQGYLDAFELNDFGKDGEGEYVK